MYVPVTPPEGPMRIELIHKDGFIRRIEIPQGEDRRLGRSNDMDIQISDPTLMISREHLVLHGGPGCLEVKIKGQNGAYSAHGWLKAGEEAVLHGGDALHFGPWTMQILAAPHPSVAGWDDLRLPPGVDLAAVPRRDTESPRLGKDA